MSLFEHDTSHVERSENPTQILPITVVIEYPLAENAPEDVLDTHPHQ